MPPVAAHFNGSVNLPDAETVMREIVRRVGDGVRRIPDGETGDRQQWIFYQLQKLSTVPQLQSAGTVDQPAEGYRQMPRLRLADGVTPEDVTWPDPGYAAAYQDSYQVFLRLRDQGIIRTGVRFQVEYPTPLAVVNGWIAAEDQDRVYPFYEQTLLADLDAVVAAVPSDDLAVQWDVAVEFAILEGGFTATAAQTFDSIIDGLVRCVQRVPSTVPVGLHLCYGDYGHRHVVEPESLGWQVRVASEVASRASRPVTWFSFTVPQDRRDEAFFAPLRDLSVRSGTELSFGIVPYHPDRQEPGTTEDQVRLIDERLGGHVPWAVSTECGMGRVDRSDVPRLLDLHREIIRRYGGASAAGHGDGQSSSGR